MKYSVMYLCNNEIVYLKDQNSEVIKFYLPKRILKFGKINHVKHFEKYFKKLLDENKLLKIISNGNLKIIINDLYSDIDKFILQDICKEIGFSKVVLINEKHLLNISKNKVYIILNDEYFFVYKYNINVIKTEVFIKQDYKIEFFLNEISKNSEIFIANNTKLNIELKLLKYYIYQDYTTFLFKQLYEMNK